MHRTTAIARQRRKDRRRAPTAAAATQSVRYTPDVVALAAIAQTAHVQLAALAAVRSAIRTGTRPMFRRTTGGANDINLHRHH